MTSGAIADSLGISPRSVKRYITELRQIGAPVETTSDPAGYRLVPGAAFELPGIWFSHSELTALLFANELLESAEPGLMRDKLGQLRSKVERLMNAEQLGASGLSKRVRILRVAGRGTGNYFLAVAEAMASRKRLRIGYLGRTRKDDTTRIVSPQRLVHYRDNWYLDAWCHSRKDLRTFALERISSAKLLPTAAKDISDSKLHEVLATAFGIFSGKPRGTAVLVFSEYRARWVSEETWHPAQRGHFLPDGRYQLSLPYSDPRELTSEILKFGAGVEVIAPEELRESVRHEIERMHAQYQSS